MNKREYWFDQNPWKITNLHNMFIRLDGAMEMVLQLTNPKAVPLAKWLSQKKAR